MDEPHTETELEQKPVTGTAAVLASNPCMFMIEKKKPCISRLFSILVKKSKRK